MSNTIFNSLNAAISFEEYFSLFEQLVSEKKTTGNLQDEGHINYTKLNWSRIKRTKQTITLNHATTDKLNKLEEKRTLLIITEAWCGDASQILPVIEKIINLSPFLQSKIVIRDEHPDLMNMFLTNGAKAVPKIIVLDDYNNVIGDWGPRPSELQNLVKKFKQKKPETTSIEVAKLTQNWYTQDSGESIQNEILQLIEKQPIIA